jgi:hypothetical protein
MSSGLDRSKIEIWLLAVVLIGGLLIRVWGINFGLPYLYHADEITNMRLVLRMFRTGEANPSWFHYPTLFFYLNVAVEWMLYFCGRILGVFATRADVPTPDVEWVAVGKLTMPIVFLLPRLLTLLFGLGNTFLTYVGARRLFEDAGLAILAALLVAVSPSSVEHSRYITPDTFVVFFGLCALLGANAILEDGRVQSYISAGVAVGLCASCKYNGALVAIAVVTAHLLTSGWAPRRAGLLLLSGAAAILAFGLTSPFVILDHGTALADIRYEAGHYASGHLGAEGAPFLFYLRFFFVEEGATLAVAAGAIIWALARRERAALTVASFVAAYFAFICAQEVRNERTALIIVPWVAILAAWSSAKLWRWLRDHPRTLRWPTVIAGFSGIALVMWPLSRSVIHTVQLTTVDSRETARKWIADNLPRRSRVAIEPYSPYLRRDQLVFRGFLYLDEKSARWYRGRFDYLIFSQAAFGRFREDPKRYADRIRSYDALFADLKLLRRFTDGGFEIMIYSTHR